MIPLRDKSSSWSGGAYARDKNTSAGLCAKNSGGAGGGGAYARGGAYLRDTTVHVKQPDPGLNYTEVLISDMSTKHV